MNEEQLNKINNLFEKAKSEESRYSFEDTKQQFLSSINEQANLKEETITSKGMSFKLWIMISTIIGVGVIAFLTISPKENSKAGINNPLVTKEFKASDSSIILNEQNDVFEEYIKKQKSNNQDFREKKKLPNVADASNDIEGLEVKFPIVEFKEFISEKEHVFEEVYRFPVLNEEEIKANNKQKKKMLKALGKVSNKSYSYIPSNSHLYKGKEVSVQAFYVKNTEVSNLEYRTFLFDLLIQGKKDQFLTARPDQKMWVKEYPNSFNEPMEQNYFSHEAYNDYPVVAISRKAAEMFCNWLTSECNKLYGPKTGKYMNDVRLPQVYEWMAAAKSGSNGFPYPWAGATTKNSKGCYLANYNPDEAQPKSDGAFYPAKVDSYLPNATGLYCMSGNVAEMVYYEGNRTQPGTKGGSWSCNAEELKIEGPDPYKGRITPSVNIGFRVVITYLHPRIENKK